MNEHFNQLYLALEEIIQNSTKQIENSSLTVEQKQEGQTLVHDLSRAVQRMKLNLNNMQAGIVGDMHHTDGEVLRNSRSRLEQWLITHCASDLSEKL